mmetsp:Transcript_14447/g.13050  ORF Transcript_14447/g.13050 Transcript_14447/m.13050 type:complete len:233 (-) Transcript_14447:132-830(-)
MSCCILYENNYNAIDSWENAFFNDCILCGEFKLKGQSGERDKRIFNLVKNNLNRIQCVGMIMASLLSVAGWFCICGIPMLINICKTNISSFEEVRNISMTENRQISYCICCSIPCQFALENKPAEIDVIFSSVITAPVAAAGNVNNNNNNNNIVINNPGGGGAKETNAHDVMMAQTLAQQQQFNAMMQLKMLEALNNPGGQNVVNPIVLPVASLAAPTAPVAEVGIAPENTK